VSEAYNRLDEQGERYETPTAFNYSQYLFQYRYRVVRERVAGPDVLEVGVGYGDFSAWLSDGPFRTLSIDGSLTNIRRAQAKAGSDRIAFEHCLFEDFHTERRFDDVLITNSLEHVDDPVAVLARFKRFLKPGGRIHVTVPNAMSVHRQLGVEMGMLAHEWSLNEHDHAVGHRRVYTRELLGEHVRRAGLTIEHADGILFKLLSNRQTDDLLKTYGNELMEGLYRLGRRMPELAAELYLCCTGA